METHDMEHNLESLSKKEPDEQNLEPGRPDSKTDISKDTINNCKNIKTHCDNNTTENKTKELLPRKAKINNGKKIDKETYQLDKFEKNIMIIFNHVYFVVGERRLGTELDVDALEKTFKQFRFDVTTHNDLTEQSLFDELDKFSKKDFTDYGCICVAILTHGQDKGWLWAHDKRYSERDVFARFNPIANPKLVAKPIMFLIQACRGPTPAEAVPHPDPGHWQSVQLDVETSDNNFRPSESDILIFHSCFFGRASVRLKGEGSWFIQTVCEQMNQNADTDHMEKLFRRVRKIIALEKEYEGVKQMPAVMTTLLKKLYLKRITEEDIYYNKLEETGSLFVRLKVKCTRNLNRYLKHFSHPNIVDFLINPLHFVITFVLTYIILNLDVFDSTYLLLGSLAIFEFIHYNGYAVFAYAKLLQPRNYNVILLLLNVLYRLEYIGKDQDFVIFFSLIFGSWYFCGAMYVTYFFITLTIILESYVNLKHSTGKKGLAV